MILFARKIESTSGKSRIWIGVARCNRAWTCPLHVGLAVRSWRRTRVPAAFIRNPEDRFMISGFQIPPKRRSG